jgi:hypothetical protein
MSRGVRPKGEKIRGFILQCIVEKQPGVVAMTVDKFGVTRQAVYKHLARLKQAKAISISGPRSKPVYDLVPLQVVEKSYAIEPTLAEHDVWDELVKPCLAGLPENVLSIWFYGFTEMFNNAIDHSGGDGIHVEISKSAQATEIRVTDSGVGIFRKIRKEFNLQDERHAIFELSKGKLTTDPKNHSGEGIFFTSRMMDRFNILSRGLFFSHRHDHKNDWLLDDVKGGKEMEGTFVTMALNNHSARSTKKIFDQFSSKDGEYGFNRTVIPVALAEYGRDGLVSRSQAKRVLARVELFEQVVFDFKGVDSIGQAFADQIFRVYANEHPKTELRAVNATAEVQQMVNRARAAKLHEVPQIPPAPPPPKE